MQKISYVIPCYRSQHTVGGVVAEIAATMQTLPQYDYEVILVNDCSPDDTFGTIRSLVAADSHVVGVDLAKNFGQHAALMAGFHKCSGDIVVCLDDDGQTPADEVGKLLAKIDEGYDVVYASYDTKRQAGWRNLGSWVNSKMTEIMLGKPPELVVNSYFAARRFIVDELPVIRNHHSLLHIQERIPVFSLFFQFQFSRPEQFFHRKPFLTNRNPFKENVFCTFFNPCISFKCIWNFFSFYLKSGK